MHIYFIDGSLQVVDSVSGLNRVHATLEVFLGSSDVELRISAERAIDPRTGWKSLSGLSFIKTPGPIHVTFGDDDYVQIAGSPENLQTYVSFFEFSDECLPGAHHHPEYVDREGYISDGSMYLTIEVR